MSTSTKWTKIVTLDTYCLNYCVDNLKEKSEYKFRVLAENSIGLSTPAVTENIKLKTHASNISLHTLQKIVIYICIFIFFFNKAVPSPPTAPLEILAIGFNASVFEWGVPESDGGAPLEGYNIAIRDIKKTMWIEVGRVPADIQKFQIKDLQEDHEYLIRIFSRNEIGLSEPLESEEPYKVLPVAGNFYILFIYTLVEKNLLFLYYGENMEVFFFSSQKIFNIFNKDDIYNFSAGTDLADEQRTEITEPTGFSTENTSSWLRENNMDADISSYARAKLLRKDEYFFRIWHYAKKLFK